MSLGKVVVIIGFFMESDDLSRSDQVVGPALLLENGESWFFFFLSLTGNK